ncbi:DNA alkylation repair protein [Paucibacter sp. O1-1]|nr:DNA alkylation repair protein [Paucibacter sp. O1-1]MDA3826001.1 DNA alkylation repair protein [Paucibacter sp. O1-1]
MAAIEVISEKPSNPTAAEFAERMESYRSPAEAMKLMRYFKTGVGEYGEGDIFMGVRMGQIFELAKAYINMPLEEIEKLLESPIHEIRTGALSIIDKQARSKKTSMSQRKALYDFYLRRTDRINNWDLVDICAPHVVGGYLYRSGEPRMYYSSLRLRTISGSGELPLLLPVILSGRATLRILLKLQNYC